MQPGRIIWDISRECYNGFNKQAFVLTRKCNFSVNECKYLGHSIGKGKIRPMQCKVDAVQAFTQHTTKKQVIAFAGICGYYRRFIPNFSTIATPLTERGATPETNEIVTLICSCHNFFSLFSVQILFIPACCLLCVL